VNWTLLVTKQAKRELARVPSGQTPHPLRLDIDKKLIEVSGILRRTSATY
jgi:hypothetical protein